MLALFTANRCAHGKNVRVHRSVHLWLLKAASSSMAAERFGTIFQQGGEDRALKKESQKLQLWTSTMSTNFVQERLI